MEIRKNKLTLFLKIKLKKIFLMNERISKTLEILKHAISNDLSLKQASRAFKQSEDYASASVRKSIAKKKKGTKLEEGELELISLHNQILNSNSKKPTSKKKTSTHKTAFVDMEQQTLHLSKEEIADIEYNAETDDDYEDRSIGEAVREDGKIKEYTYKIFIREQPPLEGVFTREEMNKVYQLYSNLDGAGLTLRAVSREFHNLTFRDFKRILRAFNITKQSVPVAPHILEESTEEEVLSLIIRNKENNILRKLEQEKGKYIEKYLVDAHKKIIAYREEENWVDNIVSKYFERANSTDITIPKLNLKTSKGKTATRKPTIAVFGDIHYGKRFESPMYGRGYNKEIAHERVLQIANEIISDHQHRNTSEIIMVCLGDLVECIMEDGMHPGHHYEMDLFQEEQIFFAVDSIKEMLKHVVENTDAKINFNFIQGNHDRIGTNRDDDKNRTAGKIVSHIVAREFSLSNAKDRVTFNIPKNNLLKIVSGRLSMFVQHGDSGLSKKKPSELVNLYGEPGCFNVLLQGHWHSLKSEEGTNFLSIKVPSVASTDRFIMEELGNNNLPGFIVGHEPEDCYGFNYTKYTLK